MAGLNNVVVARERVDIFNYVRLYVHHKHQPTHHLQSRNNIAG